MSTYNHDVNNIMYAYGGFQNPEIILFSLILSHNMWNISLNDTILTNPISNIGYIDC